MAGQIEYFGIDFGTTNIAVGGLIVDHDNKKAFRVLYGEDGVPFPSILAVKPKDDGTDDLTTIFGRKVKTQVATMQDEGYTIIRSIKTNLGNEKASYKVGTRKLDPTTIARGLVWAIRRKLSRNAGRKADIQHATIAVPVDFTYRQREELGKAFNRAGIKVDKIVSESVAAYIRNRDAVKGLSNVMVFDWGGGTLDISLLRSEDGQVFEESTIGWKVAGDAIDEKIAEYVHNQIVNTHPQVTIAYKNLSIKDKIKILSECEKAKIYFADEDEIDRDATISMFEYCGEKTVRFKLSYEVFCEIIRPIILEAVGLVGSALEKANKNMRDLNAIIMVGGSSKLLPLKAIMQNEFHDKYNIRIVYPDKPQWSVAEGAALIDSLDCKYKLNQDICVVMSDGSSHPIVRKGTGIPFDGETVTFGTVNSATSANFIFADDNNNILGDITMPAKGFLGEYFEVLCKIDNSLVAEISVTGNRMMATVGTKTLEVNQLSYYCDISGLDDYMFEIIERES